jgi:hypothetical protein
MIVYTKVIILLSHQGHGENGDLLVTAHSEHWQPWISVWSYSIPLSLRKTQGHTSIFQI